MIGQVEVADRATGRDREPRLGVLGALAMAEVLAAAGVGWILWKLASSSAGGHDSVSTHHDMVAMGRGMTHGLEISLAFLASTVLGFVLVRCWPNRWLVQLVAAIVGLGAGAELIYLSAINGSFDSHLSLMAALMTLTTAAPAALVLGLRRPPLLPVAAFRVALTTSAVAVAGTMLAWHVPGVHADLMDHRLIATLLLATAFVAGVSFWSMSGDDREATRAIRHRAVVIAGIPSGLLGLALILAPGPLMGHVTTDGLSAMTDQRLGGVLMMTADLLFMVPLYFATASGRSASDIEGG